jgi:hypothetical protein
MASENEHSHTLSGRLLEHLAHQRHRLMQRHVEPDLGSIDPGRGAWGRVKIRTPVSSSWPVLTLRLGCD